MSTGSKLPNSVFRNDCRGSVCRSMGRAVSGVDPGSWGGGCGSLSTSFTLWVTWVPRKAFVAFVNVKTAVSFPSYAVSLTGRNGM